MTSTSTPPDPQVAATAADFVARLRALRAWSGLTYRQLEKNAEIIGDALPHSTLATALSRDKLPREDLVVAFVRACGCDAKAVAAWAETRRLLAASTEEGRANGDPEPEETAPVHTSAEPGVLTAPTAVRRPGRRRRSRQIAGSVLALALTLALGIVIGMKFAGGRETRLQAPAAVTSARPETKASGRPAAWWSFEKGHPRSTLDRAGRGIPLTLGEGVRLENSTLLLNGTGRALTAKPVVNTDASFSVAAWVRLDRVNGWSTAVSQHDGPYDVFLLGHNRERDQWGFMAPDGEDGWLTGQALSHAPPKRGTWTHLTGVYNASAGTLQLYVDGRLTSTSRTPPLRRALGPLEVGRAIQDGKTIDPWHGALDDVRIFEGALSADQIHQVMTTRS